MPASDVMLEAILSGNQLVLAAYNTSLACLTLKLNVPLPRIDKVAPIRLVIFEPKDTEHTFVRFSLLINGGEYWVDVQLKQLDTRDWEPMGAFGHHMEGGFAKEPTDVFRVLEDGTLTFDQLTFDPRSDSHDSANS